MSSTNGTDGALDNEPGGARTTETPPPPPPPPAPVKVTLKGVSMKGATQIDMPGAIDFDTAKATIKMTPGSVKALSAIAKLMKDNPSITVLAIEGNTDKAGDQSSNQMLSLNRAQAVVDFLVKQGVDKARLQAIGNGASNPIAPNDTPAHMGLNRRVEFHVLEFNGQAVPRDTANTSASSGPDAPQTYTTDQFPAQALVVNQSGTSDEMANRINAVASDEGWAVTPRVADAIQVPIITLPDQSERVRVLSILFRIHGDKQPCGTVDVAWLVQERGIHDRSWRKADPAAPTPQPVLDARSGLQQRNACQ